MMLWEFTVFLARLVSWSQRDLLLSLQGVYYDAVGVYGFPYKVCVMKPKASSFYNPHDV